MATASIAPLLADSAKRNPSPLRCSSSSKRVRCAKDQVFDDGASESDPKRSCHQCRQKSSFLVASCKNQNGNRLCSLNYCRNCLSNRYGEKAEEVGLLSDWKCPKCRDICNCSCCMKKKGKQPTGTLVHVAKETGFSSVSEMLIGKGNETLTSTTPLGDADSSKNSVVSPRKSGNSATLAGKNDLSLKPKESVVASPGKDGKENIFSGRVDPNLHGISLKLNDGKKTIGVCKRKNVEKKDGSIKKFCLPKDESELKNTPKKSKIPNDKANISSEVKIEKKGLGVATKAKNLKKSQVGVQKLPSPISGKEKKSTSKNDPQKAVPMAVTQVSTKNEDTKTEIKDLGVAADAKSLKKSQGVIGTSSSPINEKVKKTVGKKDHQKAISNVVSKTCSKSEDVKNPGAADVTKIIPDNGDGNNCQLECNTNRNIGKVDDAKIEKKDKVVMPKVKTPKKSLIIAGNKLIPNSKGEKVSNTAGILLEQATPKRNSEEMSQDVLTKEDKAVESNSVVVGDKTVISNEINDIHSLTKATPEICEVNTMKVQNDSFAVEALLPQGIELTNVAGIDLPAEDVGPALQFLEFCRVFGKFFQLMKGQAESILRELTRGCTRRTRTQHSSVVQFHIQLLALLLQDSGEKSASPTSLGNSWLPAIEKCISDSECSFDDLPSNVFNKDGSGYNMLSSSQKLRLLNFLCDEALCTADLRTWIDEQNSVFFDEEKEARQKAAEAKNKEKQVKQQIQDEMDNFINSDTPLSISKHDELVSKLKTEADKAHMEYLEAIKKIPNYKQRSDAHRTEPVLFDGKGHVFWRLKSHNAQQDILVQEVGSLDTVSAEEKWFTYDVEQKGMVENYISSSGKRVKLQRVPNLSFPSFPETNQA